MSLSNKEIQYKKNMQLFVLQDSTALLIARQNSRMWDFNHIVSLAACMGTQCVKHHRPYIRETTVLMGDAYETPQCISTKDGGRQEDRDHESFETSLVLSFTRAHTFHRLMPLHCRRH